MRSAFRFLIFLIGISPLFLALNSLLADGLLAAYVAITMIVVALAIRPGEAQYLSEIALPALILAAVPAVLMIVQVLPLPIPSLQHPIWVSAQAALNGSITGSISIDPGATIIALMRYFSGVGLFFIATATTIDRQRAETVLFLLAGISTLMASLLVVHNAAGFLFLGEISSVGPRSSITAAAILGTILTAATVVYAIERYETRRSRSDANRLLYLLIIALALLGFAICWTAILFFMSGPATFAALCGIGAFALIIGFRRLGLESRSGFIVVILGAAVPLSIFARMAVAAKLDLTLRFDTDASRSFLELTQRMLSDTNWLGSGAGAFPALLPIYLDNADKVVAAVAPTTAAGIAIGLGYPMLVLVVVMAIIAIAWLISGAIKRGRDSFFSAAGASCLIALSIESFFDGGPSESATIVIATAILGLGLSQSKSRSAR